jgi:hypothetical protein
MQLARKSCFDMGLLPLYYYCSPTLADNMLINGLRMHSSSHGDIGVYLSLNGPCSLGLGHDNNNDEEDDDDEGMKNGQVGDDEDKRR